MKEVVLIIITSYIIFFTILGVVEGSSKRENEGKSGCVYKSYLSLYNPAFLLGCELVKDRTK